MSGQGRDSFTYGYAAQCNAAWEFLCSRDVTRWPWLALPPDDPIVVQALNYHGSYESAVARGQYEAGQWTALTKTDWRCGERGAGHAVRGRVIIPPQERQESANYALEFFDAEDRLVCATAGRGVVFRNRDFRAWRAAQKHEIADPAASTTFAFTPADRIGRASQVESFVGALRPAETGQGFLAQALVSSAAGFPPLHPYHDGSGDHVNAGHLADLATQFARLVLQHPSLTPRAGTMRFHRYIELDCPCTIATDNGRSDGAALEVNISQGGTTCAEVSLDF